MRRRGEHRCERAAGTLQRTVQHEGQLELDARHDEAFRGNRRPGREEHVVEQVAIVRLVDLRGHLHGARRETDLVPDQASSLGDLERDPRALDGVGVRDRHAGMRAAQLADLLTRPLGLVDARRAGAHLVLAQRALRRPHRIAPALARRGRCHGVRDDRHGDALRKRWCTLLCFHVPASSNSQSSSESAR